MHARTAPARVLALGLPALAALGCAAPTLSTRQRLGVLSISGDVKVSTDGGGAASSAEGLGFDRDGSVYEPRVDVEWGGAHLAFDWFASQHSGEGTAESDLQLDPGGDTIFAGDQVSSDLDLSLAKLAFTFDLVPTDFVDVGLGFGLGAFSYDAVIEAPMTSARIASDESFPIAFLAGRGAVRLGDFAVELDVGALHFAYQGDRLAFLDVDAAVSWRFWSRGPAFADLAVGYRALGTDLRYGDQGGVVEADVDYAGGWIGLGLGL